jgi:phospholipase/lecithinase/hemolysin
MLSTAEQATLSARVDQYNLAIKAKADQYGFAILNPNDTLAVLRSGATPQIPVFPNITSNTRDAAGSVFGALFSLDGAHPSAAGQRLIANIAIAAINAKYTLQIPLVP